MLGRLQKFDIYESMDVSFLCKPPGFNRKETKMSIQGYERLNHTIWECKYHVVFIPKERDRNNLQFCSDQLFMGIAL